MKKDMSLEGLRWSCDSGSALYDTPPNGRSRTGWGGFVENTDYDISSYFTKEIGQGRLECLSFNGNDYDKSFGKGHSYETYYFSS